VNRDINACKNILYLAKYYLQYQDRPKEFKPDEKPKNTKIKKNIKTFRSRAGIAPAKGIVV